MGQAVYQRRSRKRTGQRLRDRLRREIRGEKTITTAEAGVVLDHLLDGTLSGVQYAWSMSDHSPQDWAQPAIARLERASVLTAAQAQNPEHPLDRRTACEMLYRALILLDS